MKNLLDRKNDEKKNPLCFRVDRGPHLVTEYKDHVS